MSHMQLTISNPPKIDLRKIPALSKQHLDDVNLPTLYQNARLALRECCRVDEIKAITDKHSAIAHYAKQVKDQSLLYYAERIKLRAAERLGELLASIPDKTERRKLHLENGIAYATANWSQDIQSLPQRVRDQMIEASPPMKLADMKDIALGYKKSTSPLGDGAVSGRANRHGGDRFWKYREREDNLLHPPQHQAEELEEMLDRWCDEIDEVLSRGVRGGVYAAREIAGAMDHRNRKYVRDRIRKIWSFLDEIDQYMPEDE